MVTGKTQICLGRTTQPIQYFTCTRTIHIYNTSTESTGLQGGSNKKDSLLSLFPPVIIIIIVTVIKQQTPYATTQLGSSTCSTASSRQAKRLPAAGGAGPGTPGGTRSIYGDTGRGLRAKVNEAQPSSGRARPGTRGVTFGQLSSKGKDRDSQKYEVWYYCNYC
jgi:hypothetical protein